MRRAEILGRAPLSEAHSTVYVSGIRTSLTDGGSRRTTPNRKRKPVISDGPCHLNTFNHHDRYHPESCPRYPVTIYRRINSPLVLKKFVARLAFHTSNDCLYQTYNQPGIYGSDALFKLIFLVSYRIETAPASSKIIVGGI